MKTSFAETFRGKRVLVTGHTGFKGAWLCEWLLELGAEVTGFSLPPPSQPALFDQLGLAARVQHVPGDVRDAAHLAAVVGRTQPEFVFHLAAQSLVGPSYARPIETFGTNIMGTAHVLDAVREAKRPCVVVAVTTDKCYENREWVHGYREEDPMGGHDPYSASKGAAELVIASYRRAFFSVRDDRIRVSSVRAGNVIGGGDWAADRIIPDCVRALQSGETIAVRNPSARRPWQHVLEPLSGYLWLAACQARPDLAPVRAQFSTAFNFGPAMTSNRTVTEVVEALLSQWPGRWTDQSDPRAPHEATLLTLATDKAWHLLGWRPVWDFEETLSHTIYWYHNVHRGLAEPLALTRAQIGAYCVHARAAGLAWARSPDGAKQPAALPAGVVSVSA